MSITQNLPNNFYIFLFKNEEMVVNSLRVGQLCTRNSPISLFRWTPKFSLEGTKSTLCSIWVELPNLSFHLYYPMLKNIVEPLGKVLSTRPLLEFNPRWHPQVLVEIDGESELPYEIDMPTREGGFLTQPVTYK